MLYACLEADIDLGGQPMHTGFGAHAWDGIWEGSDMLTLQQTVNRIAANYLK